MSTSPLPRHRYLTPEIIERLESYLHDYQMGLDHRGLIIKYDIPTLKHSSELIAIFKHWGLITRPRSKFRLCEQDRADFIELLRLKRLKAGANQ